MKALTKILSLTVLLGFTGASALAEETTGEKAGDSARTASTKVKKNWRKTKREMRDATGNGSVKEDLKDAAKNTGDAVDDSAKRLKDKVD